MALGVPALDWVWRRRWFAFAPGMQTVPQIPLRPDNHGVSKIAKKDACSNRTKYIDVKYHLVRDLVEQKKLNLNIAQLQNLQPI